MSLTSRNYPNLLQISPSFNEPAPGTGFAALAGGLTATQLLGTLRRAWWLLALGGLAGGLLSYEYAKLTPDTYVASGILAVQGQRFAIPELQGAISADQSADPLPEVATEVQVLTSPRLLQQVVDILHLDRDPEFDPRAQPPGLLGTAIGSAATWLASYAGPGAELAHSLSSQLSGSADGKPAPGLSPEVLDQTLLGEVSRHLVVSHDTRSLIVDILFSARDPKVAAAVVNTLIDAYGQARFDDRERINKAANASLMRRVDEVHSEVVRLEDRVRAARAQSNSPELAVGTVNQQQLTELISSASKSSVARAEAESVAARAHALAQTGETDKLAAVVGSGTISRLRDQETQAAGTVADAQTRYGDKFPALQSARATLQSVRGQIGFEVNRTVASLDAQARVAAQQDQQIQAALSAARTKMAQSAGGQLEIKQLEAEALARRTLYETLLGRAEQTQTDPNQQTVTGARVVSNAMVPGLPAGPKRKMAAGLGGLGGMMAGGFLALLGSGRSRRFRKGSELASATGLPVLATLPRIAQALPGPKETEALRLLRNRIRYHGSASAARTVAFVDGGGRSNAAATAVAFARMAAMDGERVLLVEGAVTAPRLGGIMGTALPEAAKNGLGKLSGEASLLRDAVSPDQASGMDMLLVAAPSPLLLDLVHGTRFQMLIADAVQSYGLIVISAHDPQRSETFALARTADVVVFVVGSGRVHSAGLRSTVAGLTENQYGFAAAVLAS